MRFFILLAGILVFGYLAQFFFPWWAIVPLAFFGGLTLAKNGPHAFTASFMAVFLLWAGQALILSAMNGGILAAKMGVLLGGVPGPAMPFISGILGGLLAGLGGLSGYFGRKALE